MLPRPLRDVLFILQLAGVATLVRSIAYDRWITVLAAALLLLGAAAARRGRAWGIALAFAQATAFPVAWWIGIAPPWFCLVGLVGALPLLATARAFARADRTATALMIALGASGGALGAVGWKTYAWSIFDALPSLAPSMAPQHGLLVLATAVVGLGLLVRAIPKDAESAVSEPARLRVADPLRIADALAMDDRAHVEHVEEEETSAVDRIDAIAAPRRARPRG